MPPKKGKKMDLGSFLMDDDFGGSWADEMNDLPTAPVAREGGAQRRGDYLSTVPDRGPRGSSGFGGDGAGYGHSARDVPLPTKPPFTAYLGNLSWELDEDELRAAFAPSKLVSVRILVDHDGKPKGYGYVEFESLDELKDAIAKAGTVVAGRAMKIGPAEPPKTGGGGFNSGPSAAEEASQWRRSGPLPRADGPSRDGLAPRRGTSFVAGEGSSGGFDNMDVSGGARSGFGSKFAPSAPGPGGPRGGFGGPREDGPRPPREPLEPGPGEVASDWRTGKPVESVPTGPRGGPGGPRGGAPFQRRDTGEAEERFAGQERMGFGSKFEPAAPVTEQPRGFGFGGDRKQGPGTGGSPVPGPSDEADTWRSSRQPGGLAPSGPRGRQGSGSADRAGASGSPVAPPAERKKLELAPRSASAQPPGSNDVAAASTSNKPSPFGNAKPVNAAEREREIEQRMQEREKERKEKEAAAKAAAAAAAASARAEKPAASPVTAAPQDAASATGSVQSPAIPTGPAADAVKPKPAGPPPNAWARKKEFGKTASPSPSRSPAASTPGTSPRPAPAASVPGKAQPASSAPAAVAPTAPAGQAGAPAPAAAVAAPTTAAPPAAPQGPSTGAWGRGRAAGGALRSAPTSGTNTANGSPAPAIGKAAPQNSKPTESASEGATSSGIIAMAKDAAGQVKDKVAEVVEGVKVIAVGSETDNAPATTKTETA